MEIILIVIAILLGTLCFISFGILSSASNTQKAVSELRNQLWSIRDNQAEIIEKQFEETKNILEELKLGLQEGSSSLSDIQYIMNVIYKYKLPDKEEQEFLDKIKIDNQLSTYRGQCKT